MSSQESNETNVNAITPYEFLRNLKEILKREHENLVINKKLFADEQDFGMVLLYRDLEKKLIAFINELEFRS